MRIDERIIEREGVTAELLERLITEHEQGRGRLHKLRRYYRGEHDILTRTRKSKAANVRIAANHAKYIVDVCQSYLAGNPVTYTASDGFDIEPIKNAYFEQDIAMVDSEIVRNMCIFGRGYEMIYADENAEIKSIVPDPENVFVVYDSTAAERPILGVYYYKIFDLNRAVSGLVCYCYTDSERFEFAADVDSWRAMELKEREPHYMGRVPIIEYRNNEERQGDFEQLIPLIDAYNVLQSDRVSDKEEFVDAFLFLHNVLIDEDQAKRLREEKILMSEADEADAKYLSKVMSESDVKVLRDDLKEDIHRFSMVPDLTDESFGGNLSGVAIKYKIMGFEQHVKNKERYFSRGLRERFAVYDKFLSVKGVCREVPAHRVDIVFKRNLPENSLETAQMISYLQGIVSDETLIGQLDFVTDAKEEAAIVQQEKATRQAESIRENELLAAGGGY